MTQMSLPSCLRFVMRHGLGAVVSGVVALTALPVAANLPDCEALAARAAAAAGIPDGLLPSIARVESGRGQGKKGRRAWPWTLNQGGKGMYFETREEAMAYLTAAVARGVKNIDVGCMQINYRWHGDQFPSLEAMMDPVSNTAYAARFLTELRQRLGSWDEATGNYHSADPRRSRNYQALVARVLAKMPDAKVMLAAAQDELAPLPYPGVSAPDAGDGADAMGGAQQAAPMPGGPLVAVTRAQGDSYLAAMMGGGVLPDAPVPSFRAATPDRLRTHGELPRHLQRRWNQIEDLRREFAARPRQDG
jgi:hypothetical protein